jgi:hypothetical protein
MHKIWHWLKKELRSLFPVWLYFFLTFGLLRATEMIFLGEFGISQTYDAQALIASLIVAKAFMVIDKLKIVDHFLAKPLLYNALWKTGLYMVAALIFRHLELLIHQLREGVGYWDANIGVAHRMLLPRFWIIQIWLFLMIFIFCVTRDLIRIMGKEKFHQLMFGEKAARSKL